MLDHLVRNRRALALRGLAAIAFGLPALLWLGITLWVLVLFFATDALLFGMSMPTFALPLRRQPPIRV
jgi:uncharacterized membrane protein HdeD (DUF308 family)